MRADLGNARLPANPLDVLTRPIAPMQRAFRRGEDEILRLLALDQGEKERAGHLRHIDTAVSFFRLRFFDPEDVYIIVQVPNNTLRDLLRAQTHEPGHGRRESSVIAAFGELQC